MANRLDPVGGFVIGQRVLEDDRFAETSETLVDLSFAVEDFSFE